MWGDLYGMWYKKFPILRGRLLKGTEVNNVVDVKEFPILRGRLLK